MKAYDSAYPGSMFEKPHGSYIERNDAISLTDALLEILHTSRDDCEDALDAKVQLENELEAANQRELELLAVIEKQKALLSRATKSIGAFCGDLGWSMEDMNTMDSIDSFLVNNAEPSQALREHEAKVIEPYAEAWDDLLEDMELHGMHKFEPYIKSKANFRRMAEERRKK